MSMVNQIICLDYLYIYKADTFLTYNREKKKLCLLKNNLLWWIWLWNVIIAYTPVYRWTSCMLDRRCVLLSASLIVHLPTPFVLVTIKFKSFVTFLNPFWFLEFEMKFHTSLYNTSIVSYPWLKSRHICMGLFVITLETRRVSHVEMELLTLLEHLNPPPPRIL